MRWYLLAPALLTACSGEKPATLGITKGRFPPCPDTPNCVSSDDAGDRAVVPFRFADSAGAVWEKVAAAVANLPRTTIVRQDSTYLHAEARSRIFRFVDDLELHLRPADSLIAVRSAARVGSWDLGVNRRRIERLRRTLRAQGVIR